MDLQVFLLLRLMVEPTLDFDCPHAMRTAIVTMDIILAQEAMTCSGEILSDV
jgi:hypothetical protein